MSPAPPDPQTIVDAIETEIESTEENAEDLDELSEQLAVQSIISEERHDEIVTETAECKTKLDLLLTRLPENPTAAESPLLNSILSEVTQVSSRLTTLEASLKSLTDSRQQTPIPSESTLPAPGNAVGQEVPIIEVPPVLGETPKRKRRIL